MVRRSNVFKVYMFKKKKKLFVFIIHWSKSYELKKMPVAAKPNVLEAIQRQNIEKTKNQKKLLILK